MKKAPKLFFVTVMILVLTACSSDDALINTGDDQQVVDDDTTTGNDDNSQTNGNNSGNDGNSNQNNDDDSGSEDNNTSGNSTEIELTPKSIAGYYNVYYLEGTLTRTQTDANGSQTIIEEIAMSGSDFDEFHYNFTDNERYTAGGAYRETLVITANGQTTTRSQPLFRTEVGYSIVNTKDRVLNIEEVYYDVKFFDGIELHMASDYTYTQNGNITVYEEWEFRMRLKE